MLPTATLRQHLEEMHPGDQVVAPEERFDEVIEETKPIIDSIVHPG